MSAQQAFQSAPDLARRGVRWLRALPAARTRSTLPIIATSAVVVVIIVQLLMSVALANGAYEAEKLESTRLQTQRELTAVSGDLVRVQSPQYLANNAAALGMISNSNAVYLRLSDGAVFGVPLPADGRTLAGTNVANALLSGIPLVTDSAAAPASVAGSADAASKSHAAAPAGNSPGTPGTPTTAPGQTASGSVPLQGGFPAVHTR